MFQHWQMRPALGAIAVADLLVIAFGLVVVTRPGPLSSDMGGSHNISVQGLPVRLGQLGDFAASIDNHGGGAVTIEHAALIPAQGFATPSLYGVVVGYRLDEYEGRGWPITAVAAGGPVYALPASVAPGPGWLYYAVRGTAKGEYADLGLRVTYRAAGRTYTTNAWGGALLCVGTPRCDSSGESDQLLDEIHNRT
jgi:hypothetical protein